jgi:hypothetical protein
MSSIAARMAAMQYRRAARTFTAAAAAMQETRTKLLRFTRRAFCCAWPD